MTGTIEPELCEHARQPPRAAKTPCRNCVKATRLPTRVRRALVALVALGSSPGAIAAQAGGTWTPSADIMAQVIPVYTLASPTAGRSTVDEAYLSQPLIMTRAALGLLRLDGALNLEGLTLERGELTTGTWGEGFVDRRHPHTYVHELMLGADVRLHSARASLSFGRGFAPFGSDDPMVRPFVKYPVNHHLAQILERIALVGSLRVGALVAEAGTFNGDEPISPSAQPRWGRFGDSWSARLTLLRQGTELFASHAFVKSPESQLGGLLDHRKNHVGVRLERGGSALPRYALVEWARTDELRRGTRAFRYESLLAEAATCVRSINAAVRFERTTRPEEERDGSLFRSRRPMADIAILGRTRWTAFTGNAGGPPVRPGPVWLIPFVEASHLRASAMKPVGVLEPRVLYGGSSLWMLSVGARVSVGTAHHRMGRYGAALPDTPSSHHSRPAHSPTFACHS